MDTPRPEYESLPSDLNYFKGPHDLKGQSLRFYLQFFDIHVHGKAQILHELLLFSKNIIFPKYKYL
jgi:hypothetical protein